MKRGGARKIPVPCSLLKTCTASATCLTCANGTNGILQSGLTLTWVLSSVLKTSSVLVYAVHTIRSCAFYCFSHSPNDLQSLLIY